MTDRISLATVAIIGFGNQGEAQAHLLRESGADVIVGARPGGSAVARASERDFPVFSPVEAVRRGAIVALLLPDEVVPEVWPELSTAIGRDASVVFAHGFNLLYSSLAFPPGADVALVSPAGPGRVLRNHLGSDARLSAYLAVHQDASGGAWNLATDYATRLGCRPLWRTTVREETEVDLFGEQVVLCGGMNALVGAAFETLVERGYSPEIAYLECVHQLKYLADLLHDRGPTAFRESISGTALFGDLTRGPRVVGEPSRLEMKAILDEIRSGRFAGEWRDEVARGRPITRSASGRTSERSIERARNRALGGGSGGEP